MCLNLRGETTFFALSFRAKYIMTSWRCREEDVTKGSGVMPLCLYNWNDVKIGIFIIDSIKGVGEK